MKNAIDIFSPQAIEAWNTSLNFCIDTALGKKMTKVLREENKDELEQLQMEKLINDFQDDMLVGLDSEVYD